MKIYNYGKASVTVLTSDIEKGCLERHEVPEDVEEFEFSVELRYDDGSALIEIYNEDYGGFLSRDIGGTVGTALCALEDMFNTLEFEKAIETVNVVMKTLTGNDPEVT